VPRASFTRLALLLAALLVAAAPAGAAPAAPGVRVKLFDSNRTFDSRDAMGKRVVVLRFQATYCAPCVRESPALTKLTERYAKRGVDVLALQVQDTAADVRKFMRADKPGYAIALDPKLAVGNRFSFKEAPYTVVISKKGEILARLPGEGAIAKLPRILDDALAPPKKK
jgi:thiol-disulfide isomerase/thioredoxin